MRARDHAPGIGWLAWLLLTIVPGAENEVMSPLLGPLMVLAFCLSQALRDVYFGHVFQHVDFFAVILLAFSLSTILFGAITTIETYQGRLEGIDELGGAVTLSMAATVLMVLPLFALQVGVARTPPLTAHVIRSLGPVFVFALQQIDGRVIFSAPTLVCILAYSATAIASNLAHDWRAEQPAGVAVRCRDRAPARRSAGQ